MGRSPSLLRIRLVTVSSAASHRRPRDPSEVPERVLSLRRRDCGSLLHSVAVVEQALQPAGHVLGSPYRVARDEGGCPVRAASRRHWCTSP